MFVCLILFKVFMIDGFNNNVLYVVLLILLGIYIVV